MGAFIGYGEFGVWASNAERNAFLDWFAANRCAPNDVRYVFCKSEGNRWTGCCLELEKLVARGDVLRLTEAERADATITHSHHVAQLLGIVDSMTRGEWRVRVDSKAALDWRTDLPSNTSLERTREG